MGVLENAKIDFIKKRLNKAINAKLIHAFPVLHPDYPESERVIGEMTEWFNEHSPKD